jgi:hypothetical protein
MYKRKSRGTRTQSHTKTSEQEGLVTRLPTTRDSSAKWGSLPAGPLAHIFAFAMCSLEEWRHVASVSKWWALCARDPLALGYLPVCVRGTQCSATVARMIELQGLRTIHMERDCNLGDGELRLLCTLTTLVSLTLDCTNVTDGGLDRLCNLKVLTALALGHAPQLGDRGATAIAAVPSLQCLSLCCAESMTDAGMGALCTLSNMRKLNLTGCTGVTDAGMAGIGALSRLTGLSLMACRCGSDPTAAVVATLKGLTYLYIDDGHSGRLTDTGVRALATLPRLRKLVLARCGEITDSGAESLAALPASAAIQLFDCTSITNAAVCRLRRQPRERKVIVRRTEHMLTRVTRMVRGNVRHEIRISTRVHLDTQSTTPDTGQDPEQVQGVNTRERTGDVGRAV